MSTIVKVNKGPIKKEFVNKKKKKRNTEKWSDKYSGEKKDSEN